MKLIIKSHTSWKFVEVHKVIEWKDDCVWKTESIGFIHKNDAIKYPLDKYVLTSIATHLTMGRFCTFDPYLGEEIQ